MLTLSPPGSCAVLVGDTSVADDSSSVSHVTSRGNKVVTRQPGKPSFSYQPNILSYDLIDRFPPYHAPFNPQLFSNDVFEIFAKEKENKRMRRSVPENKIIPVAKKNENNNDETTTMNSVEVENTTEGSIIPDLSNDEGNEDSSSQGLEYGHEASTVPNFSTADPEIAGTGEAIGTSNFSDNSRNVSENLPGDSIVPAIMTILSSNNTNSKTEDSTSADNLAYDTTAFSGSNIMEDYVSDDPEDLEEDEEDDSILLINTDDAATSDSSVYSPIIDVVEYETGISSSDTELYEDKPSDIPEAEGLSEVAYGRMEDSSDAIFYDADSMEEISIISSSNNSQVEQTTESQKGTSRIYDQMLGDQPSSSAESIPNRQNLWNLGWLFDKEIETTTQKAIDISNSLQNDAALHPRTNAGQVNPYWRQIQNQLSVSRNQRKGGKKTLESMTASAVSTPRKGGQKNNQELPVAPDNTETTVTPPLVAQRSTSRRKGGRKSTTHDVLPAARDPIPNEKGRLASHQQELPQQNTTDLNTALDLFPHLFKEDLGDHDEYYYDDEKSDFDAFDSFWEQKSDDAQDDSRNGNDNNPSSYRRFFLPAAHPKETIRAVPASQFPEGLQVMALTRENFAINAPRAPVLTDLSSRGKDQTSKTVDSNNPASISNHDSPIEIVPYEAMNQFSSQPVRRKGGAIALSSRNSVSYQEPASTDIPVPNFDPVNSRTQYSHYHKDYPVWETRTPTEEITTKPLEKKNNQYENSSDRVATNLDSGTYSNEQQVLSPQTDRGAWHWGFSEIRPTYSASDQETSASNNAETFLKQRQGPSAPSAPSHLETLQENRQINIEDIQEKKQTPSLRESDDFHSLIDNGKHSHVVESELEPLPMQNEKSPSISNNHEESTQSSPLRIAEDLISSTSALNRFSPAVVRLDSPSATSSDTSSTSLHPKNRPSKRVTVNVTITTQDDNTSGNGAAGSEQPVYVLSVSVPASDSGGDANINIIQPQTHLEHEADKMQLTAQMMNDVQVPEIMNDDANTSSTPASQSMNVSFSTKIPFDSNLPEMTSGAEDGGCNCPCDCSRLDERERNSIPANAASDNASPNGYNLSSSSPSRKENKSKGCVIVVQSPPTTTTTTEAPPPLSNDVLQGLEGEKRQRLKKRRKHQGIQRKH